MAINKVVYGDRTIMDVTTDTVTPETLAEGATATNAAGEKIMGTMKAGGGGKRTCRFVIGTSTAGWTEADCDYLCDGTEDDVEINAAIQALPAIGGEIKILSGIYKLQNSILIDKSNVKLSGNMLSTTLMIRTINGEIKKPIIEISGSYIEISDFRIMGYYSQANLDSYSIGILINVKEKTITNVKIINNVIRENGGSIFVAGEKANPNQNIVIEDNMCIKSSIGIFVGNAKNVIMKGNICKECDDSGVHCVYVEESIVEGNICQEDTETFPRKNKGIKIEEAKNSIVSRNICGRQGNCGIHMERGEDIVVIENVCHDNKITGIIFAGGNSTIIGNYCGNNKTRNILVDGENNTIIGNVAGSNRKGVGSIIVDSILITGDKNIVIGNQYTGVTAPTVKSGTGNILQNNVG